jgi:hypothetical protein
VEHQDRHPEDRFVAAVDLSLHKRGAFPPRRRVGPNRVAWVPAEVVAWIEGCPRLDQHQRGPKDDRCADDHHQVAMPAALPIQDTNP